MTMGQKEAMKTLTEEPILFEEPMSTHTTIRIGGPAAALAHPKNLEELTAVMQWARSQKVPVFVCGKGSNTLVRDGGFDGVVIHLSKGFKEWKMVREEEGSLTVEAQGGVPTQAFVQWGAGIGCKGIECLAGIPGTIGGNVVMNAGTSLGSIAAFVREVTLLDAKGKIAVWSKDDCHFAYRSCDIPSSSVVVSALLQFEKGDPAVIDSKVRAVFEKRGTSQPITVPNLGSVFKNPPKREAWRLIEEAGLRGVRVGQARISEKHTNFIINEGGATAREVLVLINLVKERVKQSSGISLETEIRVIGESS